MLALASPHRRANAQSARRVPSTSPHRTASPHRVSLKRKAEDACSSAKKAYRGTIYEKMLSPLMPATTLPISTRVCEASTKKVNSCLQTKLLTILEDADEDKLKEFLRLHGDQIDINEYGSDGVTPLQRVCQAGGKVGLASTLIGYGADVKLTSRDGWSVVHMATYSGNTNLMMYLLTRRR